MSAEKLVLSVADYGIIGVTLAVSSGIGLYFQFATKKSSNEEYLLAGKGMSILPVAFSLMATFMSATSLVGIPAEMYLYGTNMAFMNLGFLIGPVISNYLFLPIYFRNDISTVYQYLELRFGKLIRRIVAVLFALCNCLFTAATLYAPALALSAVTELSLLASILVIGGVCTFYSTLGGMKAVLWADVFQAILMYVCLFAVIAIGCIKVGGVGNIFDAANEGGRLILPSFRFDMSRHYTMWNVFLQSAIITLSAFCCNQIQVQRSLTLRNMAKSRIASLVSAPMIMSFHMLCCLCGLVVFAYFQFCDPITSAKPPIQAPDQLLPYFITRTMSDFPGLPGLCITGIFSASLSTVSSALNSLAATTSEDLLRPIWPTHTVTTTKIISFSYGAACVGLSFALSSLGGLVRMSILILGMFAGPNLGVFLLAALTTNSNQEGALVGLLSGLGIGAFLTFHPRVTIDPPLPLSTDQCPLGSPMDAATSFLNMTPTATAHILISETDKFPVAYMWVSSISLVTCVVLGYVTSLIVGCFKEHTPVDPKHLSPFRTWFYKGSGEREMSADKPLLDEKVELNRNGLPVHVTVI